MKYIVFIIGPISSGKSTIAKLIPNATIIEIDDIYESNLGGREFREAYKDKKFQNACWDEFYQKIVRTQTTFAVGLTTGLNQQFTTLLDKLKREYPNTLYIMSIESRKEDLLDELE